MKISHGKKKKIKKALRVTGGLFAAVLLIYLAYRGIGKLQSRQDAKDAAQQDPGDLYYDGAWYDLRGDVDTVLLFGVDKYAEQFRAGAFINDQQADFLLLLILNNSQNTCYALPLNRDTMTQVEHLDLNGGVMETAVEQLALAHTYGSGGKDSGFNTLRAVSKLLYGVPLDHYIGISMDAVGVLADAVDGVPVLVEQDFSAVTDQLPRGQVATLTDQLALQFVRARGSVGEQTNIERMSRQQQFVTAFYPRWKEKCSAGGDAFLAETLLKLSEYMATDCSAQTLSQFNEQIDACDFVLLDAPAGEAVKGEKFMEFYVEDEPLRDTVIKLFYEKCE